MALPSESLTLAELRRFSLAQLEELYCEPTSSLEVPTVAFEGLHLAWLDTPEARHPLLRPIIYLGFAAAPFCVDFERSCWSFLGRRLKMGRFEARIGPSRWRKTDTICLHYEASRLPGPIKGLLYDEVKPLSDSLCLGLGGINKSEGRGECFYFALSR